MQDSRNMILAIVLSLIVLVGWQFFILGPQAEKAQKEQAAETSTQIDQATGLPVPTVDAKTAGASPAVVASATTFETRAAAIAATPRIAISTAALKGSINLIGGSIDDLELKDYHETVDPTSPIITLLTPAGAPDAYFTEQGWATEKGASVAVPDAKSAWVAETDGPLTEAHPVTLRFDNGAGLIFHRTISVDSHYLFSVAQSVENKTSGDVALYPYARVVRHGTPKVQNFFVQHEGPLGVLGDKNLVSLKYSDLQNEKQRALDAGGGWLGITDKYWATAVMPEPDTPLKALFSWSKPAALDIYETRFIEQAPKIAPAGGTASATSYVFAGAKEEAVIASYEAAHKFDRLELLIDWGWFHFFTKPLFYLLRFLYGILGNFGLAILAVTVIVKGLFFPLANRSYRSMAAMRRVQPEMKALQERFKDDRAAQQKATMELYQREKINPLSGCWPILIQIPVFYSLYTVLFISLEMRHAPFFGWVQDLAAQDPTNIFTLFGIIPWNPTVLPVIGHFLALGVWPVIMGITMWVQMKLNPPPPDPTQAMIFGFMPIIFTFMLGTFPAGLVIYWAWNNTLSILQQWIIMKRHGVEVDLFGNIIRSFRRKPAAETAGK